VRIVNADQMRAIDRRTIAGGVPAAELMERAGRAVAEAAWEMVGPRPGARFAVVCGKGNNGGDGFVAARHLAARGGRVRIHATHPRGALSPDACTAFDRAVAGGLEVHLVPDEGLDPGPIADPRRRPSVAAGPDGWGDANDLDASLAGADLCIDAVLGTGVTHEVTGRMAALLDRIAHLARRTIAVDVPSGIDATTGAVRGTAVWADVTVTFGVPKLGLVLHPGRERAGRLVVADIGFPAAIVEAIAGECFLVDAESARALVPRLDPAAHKYTRGEVLVVAGSLAYPGAAALAATSALRSGAGIVHLAVPQSMRNILKVKLTEVIVHGVAETAGGEISGGAGLEDLAAGADAVAIGPGLGTGTATRRVVARFLATCRVPVVVDADGLLGLTSSSHPAPRIATPHAGELARWYDALPGTVKADRLRIAREAAAARDVIVVAKGAPTIVALPSGATFVNASGNAGLATAGSGDVLTGLVAGLCAQGMAPDAAARLGVYVHGAAADRLAVRGSARSVLAGDLVGEFGCVFRDLDG